VSEDVVVAASEHDAIVVGSTQAPEKVTSETTLTPSGLEIEYSWEPKRQYRIRGKVTQDGTTLESEEELIELMGEVPMGDWRAVPSVTEVLDVLKKDGLHWWGMTVGVEGVISLFHMNLLGQGPDGLVRVNTVDGWQVATVEQAVDLLKKQHLTVNHVRDKAGQRGTAVHDVLELWATGERLPDLDLFPPSEQGYVAA
jgi:hypothetical protein